MLHGHSQKCSFNGRHHTHKGNFLPQRFSVVVSEELHCCAAHSVLQDHLLQHPEPLSAINPSILFHPDSNNLSQCSAVP